MMEIFYLTTGWGTEASILVRVFALIIMLSSVLPLQIREVFVKNGLYRLRTQLLITGITVCISNTLTLWGLVLMMLRGVQSTVISEFLQVINAIVFLILSISFYFIYHQQFNADQKRLHRQLDRLEKKEHKNGK